MKKRLVAPLFAAILLLAGCGDPGTTLPALTLTPSPTVGAPAKAQVGVQYCADDTGSYSRDNFRNANDLVAKSLINSVEPDAQGVAHASQGILLYATKITGNTYDPVNTLAPFEVPATNPPQLPALQPTPTPGDPDQYHANSTKQSVDQANAPKIAQFNSDMAAYKASLASIKSRVAGDVQRLQSWNPPVDDRGTSVWGCLVLATQRLANKPGPKYLIIASDMENNTCLDCANVHLDGMKVHVIFFQSDNAIRAQQKQAQWTADFIKAGAQAADISFDDPAASETLLQSGATLFGG